MSAVREALEAAGEAVRKALVKPPCCMEGTGCELPPCHCSRVAASAAIAAFLRALPSFVDVPDSDPELAAEGFTSSLDLMSAQALAKAVEAAAKEGV